MDFGIFKHAVAAQFERMKKLPLFRTAADKDDLWKLYLSSFPVGSDPMYRKRTEHDCSCCKSFIRAVANVVAVDADNNLLSIWDVVAGDPNYQAVADALAQKVKSHPIQDVFLHFELTAGADKTFEQHVDGMRTWRHFFVNIPPAYVKVGASIATVLNDKRTSAQVLTRALGEIDMGTVDVVLDLIRQNLIYRGAEHKEVVTRFAKVKRAWQKLPADKRDAFSWVTANEDSYTAHIRNTSIGSLLTDLATGVELQEAVKKFESKVAPANYKRPTALVTPAMIAKAKQEVEKLGLLSALERRYANIHDITINNVLFAGRDARRVLDADVFSKLQSDVAINPRQFARTEEVPIETFLRDVLPTVTSVELLVERGEHESKFVSLVAPVDPTAGKLFKWSNRFSWSYTGDFADSVKERVKKQGGKVEGDVCVRLSWTNYDDLDLHVVEPGDYEIYFGNRGRVSPSGGSLDVDMNAMASHSREPVENVVYPKASKMRDGKYTIVVNNFNKREAIDVGFDVELEVLGETHQFSYPKAVRNKEDVVVAVLHVKNGVVTVEPKLQSDVAMRPSKEVWGIKTNTFVPVSVIMLSPNYWDGESVGNKHYFFMLQDCKNDGSARPFFNEFLRGDLDQHRKVLEMVGSKMKTDNADEQLSGIGFSSTMRSYVVAKVKGSIERTIRIIF